MRPQYLSVLIVIMVTGPLWAQGAFLDPNDEIQSLIASKQLDAAEKTIVSRLMSQPRDAALITDLAEVRLNQGRAEEALRLAEHA